MDHQTTTIFLPRSIDQEKEEERNDGEKSGPANLGEERDDSCHDEASLCTLVSDKTVAQSMPHLLGEEEEEENRGKTKKVSSS